MHHKTFLKNGYINIECIAMKKIRYKDLIKIGPPRLTQYERARIIGIRALQIDYGAEPFLDFSNRYMSSIEMAEKELEAGVLPLSIKRRLIYRDDFEPIPLKWLIVASQEDKIVDLD